MTFSDELEKFCEIDRCLCRDGSSHALNNMPVTVRTRAEHLGLSPGTARSCGGRRVVPLRNIWCIWREGRQWAGMDIRRLVAVMVLVPGLTVISGGSAQSCEPLPEPTLVQAVNNQGVSGVVERQTLASNPFPWGASISVVTRIWGGIRAERWKVGNRGFVECPTDPSREVGTIAYDFRGAEAEWIGVQSSFAAEEQLAADEIHLIESEFGAAETFAVTGVDRFMANIRMWGIELTVALVVLTTLAVSLIRRRMRRRYDRHIF